MCTTKVIEELRNKTQMADATIRDQNQVIEVLIKNKTLLERNTVSLEAKLEQKDAENAQLRAEHAQLTAHLSFLSLNQKCS